MIVSDVITASRDIYNATGDTFFADSQFYNWIWHAQQELANKAWVIEATTTGATVAATQDYALPTNYIAIKRITVNGKKLKRITHRQDDAITLSNSTSTTSGQPADYTEFNNTISMRPIPDAIYTIGWMGYKDATVITTSADALTVPTVFHFDLVDYCLWRMFSKDKDTENVALYLGLWRDHVKEAIRYMKQKRRTDSFATVQSEDILPVNILGEQ